MLKYFRKISILFLLNIFLIECLFTIIKSIHEIGTIYVTIGKVLIIGITTYSLINLYRFEDNSFFMNIEIRDIAGRKSSMIDNKALQDVLPDILFLYSSKGEVLQIIAANDDLLLHDKELIVGRNLVDLLPEDISKKVLKAIDYTLETGVLSSFEYSLNINGTVMYFETRMVKYSGNEILAIIRDISELEQERKYKNFLIYQDPLTELFNRRYYMEKVNELEMEKCKNLGLILIDVNGLKLINDTFGHKAGDELLIELAEVIKSSIKEYTGLETSRIGGDEFAILYPYADKQKVEQLVSEIITESQKKLIRGIPISISVGYHINHYEKIDVEMMFSEAENYLLSRKLSDTQSMRHNAVKAILSTLSEKNSREEAHSVNVSKIARRIAEVMNLSKELIDDTYTAAKLHDIGKITVEDSILNKPSSLTDKEYEAMKRHVESSYHILKTIDSYAPLADYVYCHHERWDGQGYPRGLQGEKIPLPARIICVADAYEAMRSDRSYRKGTSHMNAVSELERFSGTQFDPGVVEAFVRGYDDDSFTLDFSKS